MENYVQNLCERAFTPFKTMPPLPKVTVEIPLRSDECPEEFGDELRRWCSGNCQRQPTQLRRGNLNALEMTFDSVVDAAMFHASAYADCRAIIAARHARKLTAMRRNSR